MAQLSLGSSSGLDGVQLALDGIGIPPDGVNIFGPPVAAPAVPVTAKASTATAAPAAEAVRNNGGARRRIGVPSRVTAGTKPGAPRPWWPGGDQYVERVR